MVVKHFYLTKFVYRAIMTNVPKELLCSYCDQPFLENEFRFLPATNKKSPLLVMHYKCSKEYATSGGKALCAFLSDELKRYEDIMPRPLKLAIRDYLALQGYIESIV